MSAPKYKRTATRVLLIGNTRPSAVYEGARGGLYVIKKGEYVGISKDFVARHEVKPPPPKPTRAELEERYGPAWYYERN
jgi:hypothetical protein